MAGTKNPFVHVCSSVPVSPSVVTIIWLWTLNLKASLGVAPKRNYDVSVHFTSSMPLTTFLVLGAALLLHNWVKAFIDSHFIFLYIAISVMNFDCRIFFVKSLPGFKIQVRLQNTFDIIVCMVFFIFGTMAWWPIRLFLAFVLYLCLILNQIIIIPEPNSTAWKKWAWRLTWIFYFHKANNLHICISFRYLQKWHIL